MPSIRIRWKIGGKIVPGGKIAGELSSQAAAIGTNLADMNMPHMNMPHTLGTASPLSNIGDILERSIECTEAQREWYVAEKAMARLVGKLLRETRLQVGAAIEVIHCKSPKGLLTEILSL